MQSLNSTKSLWAASPSALSTEAAPSEPQTHFVTAPLGDLTEPNLGEAYGPICCWNFCSHDLAAKTPRLTQKATLKPTLEGGQS